MMRVGFSPATRKWAARGIEPLTSRTRSGNHTTRLSGRGTRTSPDRGQRKATVFRLVYCSGPPASSSRLSPRLPSGPAASLRRPAQEPRDRVASWTGPTMPKCTASGYAPRPLFHAACDAVVDTRLRTCRCFGPTYSRGRLPSLDKSRHLLLQELDAVRYVCLTCAPAAPNMDL